MGTKILPINEVNSIVANILSESENKSITKQDLLSKIKKELEKQKKDIENSEFDKKEIKDLVFGEDDIVERILKTYNMPNDLSLEDLRDLQHGMINSISYKTEAKDSIGFIISLDKVKSGETASSMDGFVFDSLEKAKTAKEDQKDDRPLYIYKVNFNYPNNDNHIGSKEIKVIGN